MRGQNVAISPDGKHIIFATARFGAGGGSVWRVSAGGGVPEALVTVSADDTEKWAYMWPEVLPGGKAILFAIRTSQMATPASWEIAALSLETGEQRVLISGGNNPRYASTGHTVYGVSGALRAVRFDPTALKVIGDPIPVLQGVATKRNGSASGGPSPPAAEPSPSGPLTVASCCIGAAVRS